MKVIRCDICEKDVPNDEYTRVRVRKPVWSLEFRLKHPGKVTIECHKKCWDEVERLASLIVNEGAVVIDKKNSGRILNIMMKLMRHKMYGQENIEALGVLAEDVLNDLDWDEVG